MGLLVSLVTYVDVVDQVADPRRMSLSARHEAVLSDGRRVLLLDDRGWTESGPPDVWGGSSVEDIAETARVVVGPDEPFAERSQEDMAADHWAHLAGNLQHEGIAANAAELRRLRHDVVLSERLLARVGRNPDDAGPGESAAGRRSSRRDPGMDAT